MVLPFDLDVAAEGWWQWTLGRLVAGSVAALVVAAAGLVFRRWTSVHWVSWAWLLPLVVLVVPVDQWLGQAPGLSQLGRHVRPVVAPFLDSPAARESDAPTPTGIEDAPLSATPPPPSAVPGSFMAGAGDHLLEEMLLLEPAPAAPVAPVAPDRPWTGLPLVFAVWISGVVVLAIVAVVNHWRFARQVHRLGVPDRETTQRVARLARRSGVGRGLPCRRMDGLPGPAVVGCWRPWLLLPTHLPKSAQPVLDWILLHEIAHVKRQDLWVRAFQRVVTVLYWWFPPVWALNGVIEHHRECACDDIALSLVSVDIRRSSAEAFLDVASGGHRGAAAQSSFPALVGLAFGRSQLRRRFMRLLDLSRTVTPGVSRGQRLGLWALAVGAFGILGSPALAKLQPPTPIGEEVVLESGEVVIEREGPDPVVIARIQDRTAGSTEDWSEVVRAGAQWLILQQNPVGFWTCDTEGSQNTYETIISQTARSILALQAVNGVMPEIPDLLASKKRGLDWLLRHQREDGSYALDDEGHRNYGHGLAMMALAAHQLERPSDTVAASLQRAMDFLARAQNPYRGWRFGPPDGDNDGKMTALMMLAALKARQAGASCPHQMLVWGQDVLRDLTDPATGRVGWVTKGGALARIVRTKDRFPAELAEECTALALLVHLEDAGQPTPELLKRIKSVALVAQQAPQWTERPVAVDFEYWWAGTEVLRRLGGWMWDAWASALRTELLAHAQRHGDGTVSFPAADAWSVTGMDIYATAHALRMLAALGR